MEGEPVRSFHLFPLSWPILSASPGGLHLQLLSIPGGYPHHQCSSSLEGVTARMEPAWQVHGHDTIVIVEGKDDQPREMKTGRRWKPEDLKVEFPSSSRVFIGNRNKHKVPSRNKGLVMHFAKLGMIAVVLCAKGKRGMVEQLFPKEGAGIKWLVDMREAGHCLEQVAGAPVGEFDMSARPKNICPGMFCL